MTIKSAVPRADAVGSLLRDDAVVRAARRSSPADTALLNDAARDAIRLQEEVGLDVITDGEVRRVAWAQTPRFVDAFTAAVVTRRVATAPRIGDMTAEYEFLARYAAARTKFTLAAPSYHRRYWSAGHSAAAYDSCEEFLLEVRDYLRDVVGALVALGCDYIQLDAPNYGALCDDGTRAAMVAAGRDPDAELAFDAALDSSLFDGLTGVTTALHLCRGSGLAGARHSAGGYAAIAAALFPRLAMDRLLLEFDLDRAGGFEPLAHVPDGTVVVLGLLSTQSPRLERGADVLARIREAARHKPLAELALSTQCGFASVPVARAVTPAVQRAKLELVVTLTRQVWPG